MISLVDKGQQQGGVNSIDEINTKPIETVLNAPLTGVDQQGKPSTVGHRIIATANPAELYPGRSPLSAAMKNRFMILYMANLPEQELRYIVRKIGAEDQTDVVVNAFLSALQYGIRHHKYPLPTPALLFKTAQRVAQEIAAQKALVVEPAVVESQPEKLMEQAEQLVAQLQQPKKPAGDGVNDTQQAVVDEVKSPAANKMKRSVSEQPASNAENNSFISKYNQLKIQIVEKILQIRANPSASFKGVLLHPIRTYRNWRKRRADRGTLRSMKKKWLVGRIEELVKYPSTNQSQLPVDAEKISTKTAKKVTTKYILKKFKRAAFALDNNQAAIIGDFVQAKKTSYNSDINVKDKLVRKTAKQQLWSDIHRNLHTQTKQDVMLNALVGAKEELLTTEVAALQK